MPRTQTPRPDTVTRGTAVLAGAAWSFVLLGIVIMALGEPAGATPAIGAGIPALVFTYCWWGLRRQDQRLARTVARPRPQTALEDNATRGTGILAVLVWTLALAATAALLAGAQAAVVGVVGLYFLAVLTTASWWTYRRQDRRLAELHSQPRLPVG